MKNMIAKQILYCCVFLASSPMMGQQQKPQLIIRADDMGSFHAANVACMESYKKGVITNIEVMVVTPWFPEAVRMLKDNPGIDVGLHLAFTSEWDNVKWRPLTSCPSLVDKNGYFLPQMSPKEAYPGLSIKENKWCLAEVEQEARAQIEMALKNIPQISHISGHMGAVSFSPEVVDLMERLSEEYNLPIVDGKSAKAKYDFAFSGYGKKSPTSAEKEKNFISMLAKLEPGKRYMFLDHPAYDNDEMETVGHIGYENVAMDRQGVTDLFMSDKVRQALQEKQIESISYNDLTKALPRTQAPKNLDVAFEKYLKAIEKEKQDIHSIMILQHGKVLKEQWMSEGAKTRPHVLKSVSKTFTAMAIGFAVAEGKLKVTDKVISFFPDLLPGTISQNLNDLEVRHLLTMSSGHDKGIMPLIHKKENENTNWVKLFLSTPLEHKPGSYFVYNSMGSYVLSAIVQKVTGEKVIDYLYPRLFRPLGIVGVTWKDSPQNINCGGWGLSLKTEDLAKMGQFILQKGQWKGKQLIPESWIEEMTSKQIYSLPAGMRPEEVKMKPKESDWLQGYGYQMWRCRYNGVRADGAKGQFIIVLPDQEAVIAMTAEVEDMQAEINLVWKYILPALRKN